MITIVAIIRHKIFRFSVVGILNTLLNFAVLNFSFYELGLNKIVSNVIATCIAMMLSFFLNRKFVFVHKGPWLRQLMLFVFFTAIGMLLINNAVYIVMLALLGHYSHLIVQAGRAIGVQLKPSFVQINGSAIVATFFSMVWNYCGYQKVVFRTGDGNVRHSTRS